MSWIPFITSVARLIDLHDSAHVPGSLAAFGRGREDRPGLNDGLWLDIGIRILEYLRDHDADVSESYVSISSLVEHCKNRHPKLIEEDIRYAVTVLSTPFTLSYIDPESEAIPPLLKSTKDTALLERSRQADMCRLSKTGRETLSLVYSFRHFAYTEGDIKKISVAIEWGNFGDIPATCAGVIQKIVSLGREIAHARELAGKDQLLEDFGKNHKNYLNTIDNVQNAVDKAIKMLAMQDTVEKFESWQEREGSELSLATIRSYLDRILQTVERFQRQFSELIVAVCSTPRSAVNTISFDRLALFLAQNMAPASMVEAILKIHGPLNPVVACIDPRSFQGIMKPQTEKPLQQIEFDESEKTTLPTFNIGEFVGRYREDIIAELSKGPVSLEQAVNLGWFSLKEGLLLDELLGVFNTPESLGCSGVIHVYLSDSDRFEYYADSKGVFSVENLMMELLPQEG